MSRRGEVFRSISAELAKRPALLAAAGLMLGIAVHAYGPIYPWAWISVLGVLLAAALWWRGRAVLCGLLILLACVVSGVTLAQVEAFYYRPGDIGDFATDQPRLARLRLHLDYPPRVLTSPYGQYHAAPPKQAVTATVTEVLTWDGWKPSGGQVLVQISQPNPRLAEGQIIQILGLLERPAPAMNPGQFDWAAYYREQRILASVQISHANQIQIIGQTTVGPIAQLRRRVREALAEGFPAAAQLDHALLRALVLGDNDPELNDIRDQFRRTGTSHHLAISGMHVAVLGAVIFGLCRLMRVLPRRASVIALVTVVLYGIVALPSPAVMRSVVVAASVVVGNLSRRGRDPLQIWSLAALGLLVYHPADLFNAGFALSFGVVLGLLIFTRPLLNWFPGRDFDREIAAQFQRLGQISVMIARIRQIARFTLAAALVAWLVSLPLIAVFFEQLNPWAIVAGLVMAPVVVLALVGGFAKIMVTLLWPSLAAWAAHVVIQPVVWMRLMVGWLATFPGADVPLPAPPLWMILAYYVLLAAAFCISSKRRWLNWSVRIVALTGCALLALAPLRAGLLQLRADARDLRITLLAIGAGQTCVIEPPGAPAVLIDAGSMSVNDVLRQVLGPFLRHDGRREIGNIFISHADYDHISAVADAVAAYDARAVYVTPQFRGELVNRPAAEAMLRALDAQDKPARTFAKGQSIDIGGGASLTAVWPAVNGHIVDANDTSLVAQLRFAGRTVLFTGDIEMLAERALTREPYLIRSDVLVAPHHGSYELSTDAFVAAVAPLDIVSSNDRTPSSKQRHFDRAMKKYPVYHTDKCGAITIRITPEGMVSVETYLRPTS